MYYYEYNYTKQLTIEELEQKLEEWHKKLQKELNLAKKYDKKKLKKSPLRFNLEKKF